MKKWEMKTARGFNPRTQKKIGLFVAQLDDQLRDLKNTVKELTVKQLEWQPKPGFNSIGILLAHLSLAEVFWIKVAATGLCWEPEGKKVIKRVCGFDDDGIPLKKTGKHPSQFRGYTAGRYLDILAKGRRSIKAEMKKWHDRDTDRLIQIGKKTQASQTAMVYHVLEHFSSHLGQIRLLKHMMRRAGVMKTA